MIYKNNNNNKGLSENPHFFYDTKCKTLMTQNTKPLMTQK